MPNKQILLDHGSGGKLSHQLTSDLILPVFDNPILAHLDDGAVLEVDGCRLAFSTDTYTVDPIFFPGGNIGDLAINGTINDIAMCGAAPLYLSVGLVIEEGFELAQLETILQTMGAAARNAGVSVVTGDTKVVPKGAADKLFINTSGIGRIAPGIRTDAHRARCGDAVLLSGSIADHGITVLAQREGIRFHSPVASDTAPLNRMVAKILSVCPGIHVLRDPTRGGVGTALNEIARSSDVGIRIREAEIPVKPAVAAMCELLGFDPLYLANEGKLLAVVSAADAPRVLEVIKNCEYGQDACIVGEVVAEHPKHVYLQTAIGGSRMVDMLSGEQLPRIC